MLKNDHGKKSWKLSSRFQHSLSNLCGIYCVPSLSGMQKSRFLFNEESLNRLSPVSSYLEIYLCEKELKDLNLVKISHCFDQLEKCRSDDTEEEANSIIGELKILLKPPPANVLSRMRNFLFYKSSLDEQKSLLRDNKQINNSYYAATGGHSFN